MASGFTPEDFLPLSELVQQVSQACEAAASVFEDLTEDLNATHRLLENLLAQSKNPNSLLIQRCADRRKDWLHILESLTYALCELQEHISTYYEVGADIWLQADDVQRHFNNLRSEILVGYDAVDTFVDSLGLSPLGRKDYTLGQIEKLLVQAVREEREGTADHGVLKAYNGSGSFYFVKRYLRREGVDTVEVERHDARTKQLLIWVVENEPALTDLMARERLVARDEKEVKNEKTENDEKAENARELLLYKDDKEIGSGEDGQEDQELEKTTVVVGRPRPSASRPSSVATSVPSLVDADTESIESEWELV